MLWEPRLSRLTAPVMLLVSAAASVAAQQPTTPCSAPEYAQFDFWVGEWDVFGPNGQKAGENTIRKTMGGCVLHESYKAVSPYNGQSFNTYDPGRGVWHQTWVDNGGLLLRIEGGLQDDSMVMEGTVVSATGTTANERITWSVIDGNPNRVRQLWQFSIDGGQTWGVRFDGEYRRRPGSGRSLEETRRR